LVVWALGLNSKVVLREDNLYGLRLQFVELKGLRNCMDYTFSIWVVGQSIQHQLKFLLTSNSWEWIG